MSHHKNDKPSLEDLEKDVEFQLQNVKGWISVRDYQSALVKAKCLVDALKEIVSAEESETILLMHK